MKAKLKTTTGNNNEDIAKIMGVSKVRSIEKARDAFITIKPKEVHAGRNNNVSPYEDYRCRAFNHTEHQKP